MDGRDASLPKGPVDVPPLEESRWVAAQIPGATREPAETREGPLPRAFSLGPALPPAAPFEMSALAASLRMQLGDGKELCSYADGVMSFAKEAGGSKTLVRVEP